MIQQRERALLSEYIRLKLQGLQVRQNCPLGIVPESLIVEYGRTQALRVARKMRPEVDALVIAPDKLILIEAKILRWVDGLAHLVVYKALVPDTPELEAYKDRPVVMRMVIPFTQENMQSVAARMGVEIEEFTTPAIDEYLNKELPKYSTQEYKRRRAEIMRQREILGVQ
jgi:hypothetical protein